MRWSDFFQILENRGQSLMISDRCGGTLWSAMTRHRFRFEFRSTFQSRLRVENRLSGERMAPSRAMSSLDQEPSNVCRPGRMTERSV